MNNFFLLRSNNFFWNVVMRKMFDFFLISSWKALRIMASLGKLEQNFSILAMIRVSSIMINFDEYSWLYFQPHDHKSKVAKYHWASPKLIKKAIDVATKTQRDWEKVPIEKRLEIWLRAADLMANKYRQHLNAATMLGQSKTVIQAEIDSAAELVDFFKIHSYFVKESLKYKPISPDPKETLNSMRYRGMDGFVAAVSPFNFTAIGGNLSYTPALMVRIFFISTSCFKFSVLSASGHSDPGRNR